MASKGFWHRGDGKNRIFASQGWLVKCFGVARLAGNSPGMLEKRTRSCQGQCEDRILASQGWREKDFGVVGLTENFLGTIEKKVKDLCL